MLGNTGHEVCREQIGDANLLRLALLQKVFSEDIAWIEQLLEMGAPASCQTTYGWSALMHAACRTNVKMVELLLRFGGDSSCRDHKGRSALNEMAQCAPGLSKGELLYDRRFAEKVLGKERLAETTADKMRIERLLRSKKCQFLKSV